MELFRLKEKNLKFWDISRENLKNEKTHSEIIYYIYNTRFFKETRFPKQAQCFLKFLQFEPEMFLQCFL